MEAVEDWHVSRLLGLKQEAAGLNSEKDVVNKNLDILEIRRRVQAGGNDTWDGFDAAIGPGGNTPKQIYVFIKAARTLPHSSNLQALRPWQ